jgi:hypothetical protein
MTKLEKLKEALEDETVVVDLRKARQEVVDKMHLERLKAELVSAEEAEFMMSMSDNFCYTTGRIYPLKHRVDDLKFQIEELEKKNGV